MITDTQERDHLFSIVNMRHDCGLDVYTNQIDLMCESGYSAGLGTDDADEPGVEFQMANRFIKNLTMLMSNKDPILIHMKTGGGHWDEGMAIYNAIRLCHNKTIIINWTKASSMSSIILQAADVRIMMPDSHFMFHDGSESIDGTVKQVKSAVKYSEATYERMLNIYTESVKKYSPHHKRKTRKQIKKLLQETMDKHGDVYLDEFETVEWGFADGIMGKNGINWKSIYGY